MKTRLTITLLLVLGAALGLATGRASADGGRDFAGSYQIVSSTKISSDTVRVTLRLRLQNVSGHAVDNAVVLLAGDLPGAELGSFEGLHTLGDRAMTVIESSFDVEQRQSIRWRDAPGPRFEVVYHDAQGAAVRRPVEAVRMPVIVE
jgi:hypothetical protein